jgi:hypothetical protein
MTAPGRLAAAPQTRKGLLCSLGGTEPDRETRIGFGPRRVRPFPLAAFGGLSPGDEAVSTRSRVVGL